MHMQEFYRLPMLSEEQTLHKTVETTQIQNFSFEYLVLRSAPCKLRVFTGGEGLQLKYSTNWTTLSGFIAVWAN